MNMSRQANDNGPSWAATQPEPVTRPKTSQLANALLTVADAHADVERPTCPCCWSAVCPQGVCLHADAMIAGGVL